MSQHPIPVVIISSLTANNMDLTIKALELGAVEVLSKDMFEEEALTEESRGRICDIVKGAGQAKLKRKASTPMDIRPKYSADAVIQHIKPRNIAQTTDKIIAVGASTGGTEAIKTFLTGLPIEVPGILVVQHMPEHFTKSFAKRLNSLCEIEVKEAEDGDLVLPGRAIIAQGNKHLLLKKRGTQYIIEVKEGQPVNRHRPSVDVLFRSVAMYAGSNSVGILLTGMGDDGAKGLLEMKEAGARTIAQDEKSCVVFGMPKEAIKLEAAAQVLPLDQIGPYISKTYC